MKAVFIPFFLAFLLCLCGTARAQESYAGVMVTQPPHWTMREMQTFSGTVPSRAWIYARGDEEVLVSAMVTEGIATGLEGQKATALVKLYTESFVVAWGGKTSGDPEGIQASFCAGEAGYKLVATFGDKQYDYYGCLMVRRDQFRAAAVVTWVPAGTPEETAARRLMTFVQATSLGVPEEPDGMMPMGEPGAPGAVPARRDPGRVPVE